MTEFRPFPKIPRFYRDIVVTEKIDGTNASIMITSYLDERFEVNSPQNKPGGIYVNDPEKSVTWELLAGSRNRWLSEGSDNFGFHKWVQENAAQLIALGDGHHFGEWWGRGIQRGYGLTERRFSLFNVSRTNDFERACALVHELAMVPTLYTGPIVATNGTDPIKESLRRLHYGGSLAAPGYHDPEGVIVYHEAARQYFKHTADDNHKG